MQSLSTPRRVYPAKRARLLDVKAKERCDKAVPRPRNMAALNTRIPAIMTARS